MGNIFGCVASGLAWCFCSAAGSLLSSCCATNKDASVPPGATSGRKRSVLLLILSIAFAFGYQYGFGPNIVQYNNQIGPIGWMGRAWYNGCDQYVSDGDYDLAHTCAGQAGVYRAAGSAFLFFILAAIAVKFNPRSNREAWASKYILFIILVGATIFIPNTPLFSPILMNIFRVGAVLYILFNQLIILDLCYNLNESWVEKAEQAEIEEGVGEGRKWLGALLSLCLLLYIFCFVAIGLMYGYFSGCRENTAFITITLIMGILCTVVQLFGEDASLFTSASIFTYATYLLYAAVSKNPNGNCNPQLGEDDVAGIILGVGLTLIGLLWTGFSATAYKPVGDESDAVTETNNTKEEEASVKGIVVDGSSPNDYGTINEDEAADDVPSNTFSNSWKINIILAVICCWYAMVLTSWGSIIAGGSVANPSAGNVSMWMMISSQWLILLLYLWTLVAPRLFPDRNFS